MILSIYYPLLRRLDFILLSLSIVKSISCDLDSKPHATQYLESQRDGISDSKPHTTKSPINDFTSALPYHPHSLTFAHASNSFLTRADSNPRVDSS